MQIKKILIAYGTRYGSTEEISQEIAKTLKKKGLEPELYNLGEEKTKKWPNVDEFDGVMIGTSLKVNSWKKQVKNYVNKYRDQLKKKNLAVFTCGAYAIGAPKEAYDDIAKRLLEDFELEADIYDAFGGVLDFSENSKVGRAGRGVLKLVAMGFSKEFNMEFDMEGSNDYRDWDKIRSFAENFAEKL